MTAKSIAARTGAILVALVPLALFTASAMSTHRGQLVLVGEAFAMIALVIGALDFYVTFIRQKTPRVTPAPLVGLALVLAAGVLAYGDRATAIFATCAYLIDTAGPPWFIAARWRDRTLWG